MSMKHPNWIKARAECTLDLSFQALSEIAKNDVEMAKSINAITQEKYSFHFQRETQGEVPTFEVTRILYGKPERVVRFKQYEHRISCSSFLGEEYAFDITAVWDEQNSCCELLIKDAPHQAWQVIRKALEPMFFK